jgi:hypothetical protein
MRRVHKYLDIPYHNYDFDNIKQVTFENDKWHGKYGNHSICNKVKCTHSVAEEVLGKRICNALRNNNKWYYEFFNY